MTQINVRGKILLPSNPASLPSPSFLHVGLSDTSRMGAPAIRLAKSSVEISQAYNASGASALAYSLTGELPEDAPMIPNAYSVAATINVGWTPTEMERLRQGDYLNDTMHNVPVEEGRSDYEVDIQLIHYT